MRRGLAFPRARMLGLVLALLVLGCERSPAVRAPVLVARAADRSVLCRQLTDRFVGLPVTQADPQAARASAPLAGRFWIRSCSASTRGDELDLRLTGPGWYWVNQQDGAFTLRQQVPFDLALQIQCRVHVKSSGSLLSFWFEPTREPKVSVTPRQELEVRSANLWGALLRTLPFSAVSARAASRFSTTAASLLRDKLHSGATLTYDLATGQADGALDQLVAGLTPAHPFADGAAWVVNDRLLLEPSGSHVVGPIEPGARELDVDVERGPGLEYRAVCAEDMDANFDAVASGRVERIAAAVIANGEVTGPGVQTRALRVGRCKFYLVVTTRPRASTLAALRIRA